MRSAGWLLIRQGTPVFIHSLTGVPGFLQTMAGSEVFVQVPQTPLDTGRQVWFRFVRSVRRVHDRFSNPFLKQVRKSRSGEQRESERNIRLSARLSGNMSAGSLLEPDYCVDSQHHAFPVIFLLGCRLSQAPAIFSTKQVLILCTTGLYHARFFGITGIIQRL